MNAINETSGDPGWRDLEPELDRLMGRLGEKERSAVVLRYFQRMDSPTAARLLGVSEPTLRKRLSRAVEKLRELFRQRGIVAPAAALTAFLSADASHAAPATIVDSVTGSVTGGAATDANLYFDGRITSRVQYFAGVHMLDSHCYLGAIGVC